jgi:hypothetical protein
VEKFAGAWNRMPLSVIASRGCLKSFPGETDMERAASLFALATLGLVVAAMPALAGERTEWREAPAKAPLLQIGNVAVESEGGFSSTAALAFIEQAGYTGVTNLEPVDGMVWRATAYKDGQKYSVAVDHTGTVVGSN